MKALSIRQPWSELVLQGRKTIELRTWKTNYRGRIAVHAAQKVELQACAVYGFDPAKLVCGALVGTVDIVEMVPLNEKHWDELRDQHLDLGTDPGDLLGWRLANPQRLPQPIPMPGHLGLFNVPDQLALTPGQGTASLRATPLEQPTVLQRRGAPTAYRVGSQDSYDPEKPFELRVVPDRAGSYRLALYQWPVAANAKGEHNGGQSNSLAKPQRLVELRGGPLQAVTDQVLEALRKAGYRATDLSSQRREPFRLAEETGLRLGLLFLTVKPLTHMARIEAISSALRAMPSEEAYYWFSKCTASSIAVNAQRALRIMLAGE